MTFKKRDIHNKLITKFRFTQSEGSHEKFSLYIDDHKILTTHTSRSHDDIDDSILQLMARELGVQKLSVAREMFACTISRDDYLKILLENNYFERFRD